MTIFSIRTNKYMSEDMIVVLVDGRNLIVLPIMILEYKTDSNTWGSGSPASDLKEATNESDRWWYEAIMRSSLSSQKYWLMFNWPRCEWLCGVPEQFFCAKIQLQHSPEKLEIACIRIQLGRYPNAHTKCSTYHSYFHPTAQIGTGVLRKGCGVSWTNGERENLHSAAFKKRQ